MDKLYSNYVSAEKDDEHPIEIVYWEDAMKEIKRLRKLVKVAYSEGWHDCYDHLKDYTIINDWNKSKLKIDIEQALKEE